MLRAALYRYPLFLVLFCGIALYAIWVLIPPLRPTVSAREQLFAFAERWTRYDAEQAQQFRRLASNYYDERLKADEAAAAAPGIKSEIQHRQDAQEDASRRNRVRSATSATIAESANPIKVAIEAVRLWESSLTAADIDDLLREALSKAEQNEKSRAEIAALKSEIGNLILQVTSNSSEIRAEIEKRLARAFDLNRSLGSPQPTTDAEKRDWRLWLILDRIKMSREAASRVYLRNLGFLTGKNFQTDGFAFRVEVRRLPMRESAPRAKALYDRSTNVPLFPDEPSGFNDGDQLAANIMALYLDCEEAYRGVYKRYMKSLFLRYLELRPASPGMASGVDWEKLGPSAWLDAALRAVDQRRYNEADVIALDATPSKVLGDKCPTDAGSYFFTAVRFR